MDNEPPPEESPPGDLPRYSLTRCEASETTISCDSRDIASHEYSMFSEQALDATDIISVRCDASDTQISCDSPMDTSEPIGENSSLAETDPTQLPESVTGTTAGNSLMAHQPTTPPASQPDDSRSQDLQASDLLQSSSLSPASLRKARSAQDLSPLAKEQPLASMTASMEQPSVAASVKPPPQVSSRVRDLSPTPSVTPAKAQRSSSGPRRSSLTHPLPSNHSRAASSSSSHRGSTRNRRTEVGSTTKLAKLCSAACSALAAVNAVDGDRQTHTVVAYATTPIWFPHRLQFRLTNMASEAGWFPGRHAVIWVYNAHNLIQVKIIAVVAHPISKIWTCASVPMVPRSS
ncbi:hypothetical protein COOONC_00537 [Cooperia oncophora]